MLKITILFAPDSFFVSNKVNLSVPKRISNILHDSISAPDADEDDLNHALDDLRYIQQEEQR